MLFAHPNSFLLYSTRNFWLGVCTFLERALIFCGIQFIARVPTPNLMWNSRIFSALPRFCSNFKDPLFQIKLAVYFSPSRIFKDPSQWFSRTFQGLFISRIFKDCGNPVFDDHRHLSVLYIFYNIDFNFFSKPHFLCWPPTVLKMMLNSSLALPNREMSSSQQFG